MTLDEYSFVCLLTILCVCSFVKFLFFFCLFKDFIYLFMRDRERDRERQRNRQREKQASCREPHGGLDPRTPGSHPERKGGAKPLSHLGCPLFNYFAIFTVSLFIIGLEELLIYSGYKDLLSYICCKYFFPWGLSSYFTNKSQKEYRESIEER